MSSVNNIKQRFRIVGNDESLNRALEKAIHIAPTDISVLVMGESGVGKEFIPKIIHNLSPRKHYAYIAVNCGAIPEGTIDSELFGHEKGAFTGATSIRKGYFEFADKGTIFLDEVGELPISTQVRLLRILESGEFIKVGSSNIQKIHVRIVAATNVNLIEAIKKGKFREDLYYRLNTVQIDIPPLRFRKLDIVIIFKKFSNDFAEKYNMPPIKLTEKALKYIENYPWPGNIRQLKNFSEQISVLETNREISIEKTKEYLNDKVVSTPPILANSTIKQDSYNERDILYKILFDMRKDLNDLKSLTLQLIQNQSNANNFLEKNRQLVKNVFGDSLNNTPSSSGFDQKFQIERKTKDILSTDNFEFEEIIDDNNKSESLFLQEKELEFIQKALKRNHGKRKIAAKELGISERTLYRKIKQYGIQ